MQEMILDFGTALRPDQKYRVQIRCENCFAFMAMLCPKGTVRHDLSDEECPACHVRGQMKAHANGAGELATFRLGDILLQLAAAQGARMIQVPRGQG